MSGRTYNKEVTMRNTPVMAIIRQFKKHLPFLLVLLAALLWLDGCVYFNTFYNGKKAFNSAEKSRKATGSANMNDYQTAIAKSLKIIDNYPKSKYYDDALYVLAVSYYHTKQYEKSERRFRELLANYPNSKYTREATVYLAQAKLQLGETDEAMAGFEGIFKSDYPKQFKAQAAMELGQYHVKEKRYELSTGYFRSVRDSLGDQDQQRAAQTAMADGLYDSYQFGEALGSYLQILGLKPDKREEYHALFRAADCAYKMVRVTDGLAYLKRLADNRLFFDSLGAVQLKMAEGHELEGDMTIAQGVYGDVAATSTNKSWVADAYYHLGLIFQFDYDNLDEAKFYYDKAVEAGRLSGKQTDALTDALQRSADISKIGMYQQHQSDKPDTTAVTQAKIDDAADKQYALAELYWYQLDKPDSAMADMRYIIDSFPSAQITPRAMLALSQMVREHDEDTARADSILHEIPVRFPHSDYLPEIFERLGLCGSPADTGYAELYIRRAENFWSDDQNIDSARFWYQYVVDNFPQSAHYDLARFALIWLTENYRSPGDSTVYFAYKEFADSFPKSAFGDVARSKLVDNKSGKRREEGPLPTGDSAAKLTQTISGDSASVISADSAAQVYVDPQQQVWIRNKESLPPLDQTPVSVDEPFEFPEEAYTIDQNDFYIYFQVLLDYTGKVIDSDLKTPSGNAEIDRRAKRAITTSTFNMQKIRVEYQDKWMVYKMFIQKPTHLR